MFDHVGIGVTDLAASKAFILQALAPLKVSLVMEGPYGVGIGQNNKPSLWLHESKERTAPLHIAFSPPTEQRSKPSTPQRSLPEAKTTELLAYVLTTTRTTTGPS